MYCFHCHDVQLRDNLRYHIIFTGAYPGFQRGGYLRSGPIRKVGEGGRGQFASGPIRKVGGAIRFRSDTKSGGAIRFRSDTKSGGAIRFRSDTKSGGEGRYLCLATLPLITINGYNFDQGGAQALHTHARMSLIVVFNFIYSLIVFILETEGGARAP